MDRPFFVHSGRCFSVLSFFVMQGLLSFLFLVVCSFPPLFFPFFISVPLFRRLILGGLHGGGKRQLATRTPSHPLSKGGNETAEKRKKGKEKEKTNGTGAGGRKTRGNGWLRMWRCVVGRCVMRPETGCELGVLPVYIRVAAYPFRCLA